MCTVQDWPCNQIGGRASVKRVSYEAEAQALEVREMNIIKYKKNEEESRNQRRL